MTAVIIIGVLFILFLIGSIWCAYKREDECTLVCLTFTVGFMTMFIYEGRMLKSPQAIDVYRGKTTLEITYKDSVVVDSVVVFK